MKQYGHGYVYIYNPEQKDFYIDEDCSLIDSGIHPKTKKTYWIFRYDDVQETYNKWMTRKHE